MTLVGQSKSLMGKSSARMALWNRLASARLRESVQVLLACAGMVLFGVALADTSDEKTASDGGAAHNSSAQQQAPNMSAFSSLDKAAKAELKAELMYQLLVAEFAMQRGMLDLALDNYLRVVEATQDAESAERAVRIAVYARDPVRGMEAARLWAEVSSGAGQSRRVYALLLARAGNEVAAVEQFRLYVEAQLAARTTANAYRTASGSDEPAQNVFDEIGDLLGRERDNDRSLRVFEQLVDKFDEPVDIAGDAARALARMLARVGQTDRAGELLDELYSTYPNDPATATLKARIEYMRSRPDVALETLANFLRANPDSLVARKVYARMLVDSRRFEEAREQFETVVEAEPDNAEVVYALALLHLQTNRYDESEKQFRRLLQLQERPETALYYLGQIAETRDELEDALASYRRVDRGEHRLSAQIRAAFVMAEIEDVARARRHLRAITVRSKGERIRLYRAEAELLSGRELLKESMEVYGEAVDAFPTDNDLLYARAMLAVRMDDLERVEADLGKILEREPDNADALNALGYTLADRTTRYDEALELIRRAYELKPDDHYVVDSMGWVMYRLGRYEDAITHLRRAMELNPDPEVAAHLGEVLWVSGDKSGAREVWDAALKAQPEDKRLLDVIKRFGL